MNIFQKPVVQTGFFAKEYNIYNRRTAQQCIPYVDLLAVLLQGPER